MTCSHCAEVEARATAAGQRNMRLIALLAQAEEDRRNALDALEHGKDVRGGVDSAEAGMSHMAGIVRQLMDLRVKDFWCVESGSREFTDPRTGEECIELMYLLKKAGPKAWPTRESRG